MKLLELEADIVAAVSLRADASVPEIARIVGARVHKCRHVLDKLIQHGIISRRVVINPARLGYGCYGLWFSMPANLSPKHDVILNALVASKNISYLGEFSGEFEWRADILARSAKEADETIGVLSEKVGLMLASRSLSCSLSIRDFSLNSLTSHAQKIPPICVEFDAEPLVISEQDRAILAALTNNSAASQSMLARSLRIPLTTLNFRIKKLRESGVIVGYHMLTEVEQLRAYNVTMHVHRIRLTKNDKASRKVLLDFAAVDQAVHGLTFSFGDIDAELCSTSTGVRTEHDFEKRLKNALSGSIASLSSLTVYKNHKVNAFPF